MPQEILRAWVRFLFGNPLRTLTIAAIAYVAYRPEFVRAAWQTAIATLEQAIMSLVPLAVISALLYWLIRQMFRR